MKTQQLIISTLLIFLFAGIFDSQAQRRGERANRGPAANQAECVIPDLTEEQQNQINELRTKRIKASTQHRANMAELRAKKRSLSIADTPDMNKVNAVIDDMAEMRSANLKENAAHRQAVREILTDEQRVIYDSRHANRQGRGQQMYRRGGGQQGEGFGGQRNRPGRNW